MTSYREAYKRISAGTIAASTGFANAKTGKDAARFIEIYHMFDDELDALIAGQLKQSAAAYAAVTKAMQNGKQDLEDVVDDIGDLVNGAEIALKIATVLSKVISVL